MNAQEGGPVRIGRCEIHGPHAEAEAIAAAYANRAETAGEIEGLHGRVEDLEAERIRLFDQISRLKRVITTAIEL